MLSPVKLPPRYSPDLELLGSGGFGAVYRTRDRERDILVAIKVPFGAESTGRARATLLELRAAAALRHPGFVQVLDADLDPDGVPYLVMEYANGGTLGAVASAGALPWDAVRPWVLDVVDALGYAHAAASSIATSSSTTCSCTSRRETGPAPCWRTSG